MISCNEYDYIEIACMYRYPIKLTLKSGEVLECVALDTARNNARQECIKIDQNGEHTLIELDTLVSLDVLVTNPHFQAVRFSQ
ncbi:Rho-binding antiterminator [Vibrio hepatarius]|uniref:Rho-binding antiterminator n=1 Tax=Vibrio hepatarius TaxID=171383 RepID=UPI00142DB2EB|nr:Rho-binding antiterminator [Vibrio hepatarius]NIY83194.1 transcriptional regulator [Vibrio hepatarius]